MIIRLNSLIFLSVLSNMDPLSEKRTKRPHRTSIAYLLTIVKLGQNQVCITRPERKLGLQSPTRNALVDRRPMQTCVCQLFYSLFDLLCFARYQVKSYAIECV